MYEYEILSMTSSIWFNYLSSSMVRVEYNYQPYVCCLFESYDWLFLTCLSYIQKNKTDALAVKLFWLILTVASDKNFVLHFSISCCIFSLFILASSLEAVLVLNKSWAIKKKNKHQESCKSKLVNTLLRHFKRS